MAGGALVNHPFRLPFAVGGVLDISEHEHQVAALARLQGDFKMMGGDGGPSVGH